MGCPMPEEGFHDLLGRARMLKEHEKQFMASALTRGEARKGLEGANFRGKVGTKSKRWDKVNYLGEGWEVLW